MSLPKVTQLPSGTDVCWNQVFSVSFWLHQLLSCPKGSFPSGQDGQSLWNHSSQPPLCDLPLLCLFFLPKGTYGSGEEGRGICPTPLLLPHHSPRGGSEG